MYNTVHHAPISGKYMTSEWRHWRRAIDYAGDISMTSEWSSVWMPWQRVDAGQHNSGSTETVSTGTVSSYALTGSIVTKYNMRVGTTEQTNASTTVRPQQAYCRDPLGAITLRPRFAYIYIYIYMQHYDPQPPHARDNSDCFQRDLSKKRSPIHIVCVACRNLELT